LQQLVLFLNLLELEGFDLVILHSFVLFVNSYLLSFPFSFLADLLVQLFLDKDLSHLLILDLLLDLFLMELSVELEDLSPLIDFLALLESGGTSHFISFRGSKSA